MPTPASASPERAGDGRRQERAPGAEAPDRSPTAKPPSRPEEGFAELPPFRLGIAAGGHDRTGDFTRLSFRAGYDALDTGVGDLAFLPGRLRYDRERGSLRLEDFSLWDFVWAETHRERTMAITTRLGAARIRDEGCDACLAWVLDMGMGPAGRLFGRERLGYLVTFDFVDLAASRHFRGSDVRYGIGASVALHARLHRRVSAAATASWRHLFTTPGRTYEQGLGARWHVGRGVALDFEGKRYPTGFEGTVGILYYFGPDGSSSRPASARPGTTPEAGAEPGLAR